MTEHNRTSHDLGELEGALKKVFDLAPTAKGFFVSVIDENQEAHTLFKGDPAAADAMLALMVRYVADQQDVNAFEKILETQKKLMHVHPEEFKTYADQLERHLHREG